MLKAVGIQADPIIIMTNDSWSVDREFPAFGGNHCISRVHHPAGKDLILDPTSTVHRYPSFAWMDSGVEYMDAIARSTGVVPLPAPEEMLDRYEHKITLASDGSATGELTIRSTGDVEAGWRSFLLNLDPQRIRSTLSSYLAHDMPAGTRFGQIAVGDPKDLTQPLVLRIQYTIPQLTYRAGNLIFCGIPGVSQPVSLVSLESRRYALRTTVGLTEYQVEISLPDGVRAASLPRDTVVQGPKWDYKASFRMEGRRLVYHDAFAVRDLNVTPEEYGEFRKTVLKAAEDARIRAVLRRDGHR
jgi:hypothetical protein